MFKRIWNWLAKPSPRRLTYNPGSMSVMDRKFDWPVIPSADDCETQSPSARPPYSADATGAPTDKNPARRRRKELIREVFDPSRPVDGRFGLSGREEELNRLIDAVLFEHKHGIVFGPRGSGKTSLARAFGDIADGDGATVLYNSAGGNLSFVDLFRPFLRELANSSTHLARTPAMQQLLGDGFDASLLASSLAETVTRRTIFLVDEFDRIESPTIKAEVAALMKLLSDMRSNITVIIIGIAGNLDDLLCGHPSLRRHLTSISLAGLAIEDQRQLLQSCCDRSGLTIDADAAHNIRVAAIGSPYHIRLFGLYAALVAERSESTHITNELVEAGFSSALGYWSELNFDGFRELSLYVDRHPASLLSSTIACWLAAMHGRFTQKTVTEMLIAERIATTPVHAARRFEEMLRECDFLFHRSPSDDSYSVRDTLLPQFFILMLQGVRPPSRKSDGIDPALSVILADERASEFTLKGAAG